MKITYYGTGAGGGVPELLCSCRVCAYARQHGQKDLRTRSQATVDSLMIDYPVDVFAHCAFYGLDMRNYRHVLITHPHYDHFLPADLSSRYTDESNWTFYLTNPAYQTQAQRREDILHSPQKTPPRRIPDFVEMVPFHPMEIAGARVTPLPSQHAQGQGAVIYLIESKGKNLLWMHDSGLLLPETEAYLRTLDLHLDAVSLDCTLGRGNYITPSHMDILQCTQTAQLLRDIGRADESTVFILSHISHLHGLTHEELCQEAKALGFIVAYDKMELDI